MITAVEMNNFGPLTQLRWDNLSEINLVIGSNGSGKTFLLKAIYCAMRTLEEYKRGNVQRNAAEILADKLYWTFQPDKIGDLVSKGAESQLDFKLTFDNNDFSYSFGKDTTKQISALENHVSPRMNNSIFLPAKEILSLYNIILKSRDVDKVFGFDDTYLDLARALSQSPKGGKNYKEFASSRQSLESILGGKIEYDENSSRWYFKKGNQKYPLGTTAEGVKKIAILDTLLSNRFLDPDSIVFIDELESALHPSAISKFLDIIDTLADRGIQFFIASHSYFVVKKLFLIAQEKKKSISLLSFDDASRQYADLKAGMPDNSIITESIELYKKEINMVLE